MPSSYRTRFGAEGMRDETQCSYNADGNQFTYETDGSWGGTIASEAHKFVDAAVAVYTRKEQLWKSRQKTKEPIRWTSSLMEESIYPWLKIA